MGPVIRSAGMTDRSDLAWGQPLRLGCAGQAGKASQSADDLEGGDPPPRIISPYLVPVHRGAPRLHISSCPLDAICLTRSTLRAMERWWVARGAPLFQALQHNEEGADRTARQVEASIPLNRDSTVAVAARPGHSWGVLAGGIVRLSGATGREPPIAGSSPAARRTGRGYRRDDRQGARPLRPHLPSWSRRVFPGGR